MISEERWRRGDFAGGLLFLTTGLLILVLMIASVVRYGWPLILMWLPVFFVVPVFILVGGSALYRSLKAD
jgi:hypothetical protein